MATVREIIEKLQKLPPDALFLVNNREYGVRGDDKEYPIVLFSGTYDTIDYGDGYISHEINYKGAFEVASRQNCVYIHGD